MYYIMIKPNIIFTSKEEKQFKEKAEKLLGRHKRKIASVGLYYLLGIPTLDEIKKYSGWNTLIQQHEKGLIFKFINSLEKVGCILSLEESEVVQIAFVDGEEIIKQKSVIKRGIAGALIAGSIGAIVGGLSGLQEVKKQNKYMVIETQEGKIIFECTAGIYSLEKEFKSIFKEKVVTTEDIKKEQDKEFLNNI